MNETKEIRNATLCSPSLYVVESDGEGGGRGGEEKPEQSSVKNSKASLKEREKVGQLERI